MTYMRTLRGRLATWLSPELDNYVRSHRRLVDRLGDVAKACDSRGVPLVSSAVLWVLDPDSDSPEAYDVAGLLALESETRRETYGRRPLSDVELLQAELARPDTELCDGMVLVRQPSPLSLPDLRYMLEKLVRDEWPEGRSAGAVARELVRTLGCAGLAPTLRHLLTVLLNQAGRASTDRSFILGDFGRADEAAYKLAAAASFNRTNVRHDGEDRPPMEQGSAS